MQYLHWGSETPEQRKKRMELEEQVMLQKAIAKKVFEQRAAAPTAPSSAATAAAAAASGAAGGAPAPTSLLYFPDYYMIDPEDYAY